MSAIPSFAGLVRISLVALALSGTGARAAEFYVGVDGSDANPGTAAKPFATLERARDAVRALRRKGGLPAGGVTVWVRGGRYFMDRTFELREEDSGTPAAPILYRASPGQRPRLVGGRPVSGFRVVSDPSVLARLAPGARGHVMEADLRPQGITDFGRMTRRGFVWPRRDPPLEVFFRDRPMTLARWPNDGFLQITSVPKGPNGGEFGYDGERPARWKDEPEVWVHGYWNHDWADSYERVRSIDSANRIVATEPPHGVYGYKKGQRFYFLNVLAELDRPGEYYVDRRKGVLYFWPPGPLKDGDVVASVISTLVSMKDASYVTLRGLTMEDCRGTAVSIEGGTHDLIAGCTIRNTGRSGVSISGGRACGVVGCDIYETGGAGVLLSGGERRTLTPAHHYVDNCHIFRFSRICRTYRPAVGVSGVGNRLSHCLIHDGPHAALLFSGNDHVIEFNEIHSVCYETGDVGAIYSGRDWTARGTVIRHNFLHHVRGIGRYGANGIYLDDAASGITVTGNVFFQVTRAAYIGGGRDNTYENNIFVNCVPALHVDARALGWMKAAAQPDGVLQERLRAVPYRQPPWSERYPRLVNILDDEPAAPKGNLIARNVQWLGTWDDIDEKARPYLTIRDNLLGVDPHFVDASRMDFRLREDSPAWKIGFKPIPFDRIGPYEDELRPSWPVRSALRLESRAPTGAGFGRSSQCARAPGRCGSCGQAAGTQSSRVRRAGVIQLGAQR